MARTLPSHGRSRGFESLSAHQFPISRRSFQKKIEKIFPRKIKVFNEFNQLSSGLEDGCDKAQPTTLHIPWRYHKTVPRITISRDQFLPVVLPFAEIIAARKQFFKDAIKYYEKITRAHFLDFELGNTGFPVVPAYGDDRESVTAQKCLERNFHSEVEVL